MLTDLNTAKTQISSRGWNRTVCLFNSVGFNSLIKSISKIVRLHPLENLAVCRSVLLYHCQRSISLNFRKFEKDNFERNKHLGRLCSLPVQQRVDILAKYSSVFMSQHRARENDKNSAISNMLRVNRLFISFANCRRTISGKINK